jgi:hypothetical protein
MEELDRLLTDWLGADYVLEEVEELILQLYTKKFIDKLGIDGRKHLSLEEIKYHHNAKVPEYLFWDYLESEWTDYIAYVERFRD